MALPPIQHCAESRSRSQSSRPLELSLESERPLEWRSTPPLMRVRQERPHRIHAQWLYSFDAFSACWRRSEAAMESTSPFLPRIDPSISRMARSEAAGDGKSVVWGKRGGRRWERGTKKRRGDGR